MSPNCTYPAGNECSAGFYCVFLEPDHSKCVASDNEVPVVLFPREPTSKTVCTQPARSNVGRTHSYLNTVFAVDLSSPAGEPNAQIRAVFDGIAISSVGCENKDGEKFNNDRCGYGFGNWILLFDQNSELMAFYAHLRSTLVKDNQHIKKGEIIGEEGKTGAAGHRHLHFSIHRNILKLDGKKVKQYGIWLPPSIPFKTDIRMGDQIERGVSVTELPCVDSNDLSRPPFYGAF